VSFLNYLQVSFVRPGFLGSVSEFRNRFENPIKQGQHADSTKKDVRRMKYRAHVLHQKLQGFVQVTIVLRCMTLGLC
jgi:transcriptional regulator ATRX